MYNLMMMKNTILLFFVVVLAACKPDVSFEIKPLDKKNNTYSISIDSDYVSPLYEIEFKCLNTKNFSQDSFELISYKLIDIENPRNLSFSKNKKGFQIKQNKQVLHKLEYPKNAKSKKNSITNSKNKCISHFNQLLRIEYTYDVDNQLRNRYVKLLGYSSSSMSDVEGYDWDYFFNSKENLFYFFRENFDCEHDWDKKVKY